MSKYKKDFPIFENNPNLIYLDSAASALKVKHSLNKMNDYYGANGANVHRGAYDLAYRATKMYEDARKNVAKFINANANEVVFTKGATQAINMVANHFLYHISEGDEIIVNELEHHASLLPFMMIAKKRGAVLKYIPLTKEGRITVENFKKVLSNKTKVVSITLASNVLGYITPIKEIVELAHNQGAYVIGDAAQSIGHISVDVKDINIDYLAFSGHKIYGPTGVGVLYGKKELLDVLEPFEYGGEMVDEVTINGATFKSSPLRLEAGTPVIGEAIGLSSAIDYLVNVGYENINEITTKLKQYTLNKLLNEEGFKIYNKNADIGIITLNIDDIHPHDVASFLDAKNIAVRAGQHCAQLVTKFLNTNATLRVSFNIYNTIEDCDKLVESLIETRDFFRKEF